ncbi:MAG: hypothetical protein ACRDY1_03965 [Acidimicrobiales bacterium]
MVTRRRKRTVQALPGHLHRDETWNGLRPGDAVEIEGQALRGATWTFRAYVHNDENGATSVEVLGGRPGDHRVRSFLPGQVYPAGARRSGKPSLDTAPQLPLG